MKKILLVMVMLGASIWPIWYAFHHTPRLTQEEAIVVCIASAFRGEGNVDSCMAGYGYTK